MSIRTTFKRVALVAVAALGAGLIYVAPASALADKAANLTIFATSSTTPIQEYLITRLIVLARFLEE